MIPGRKRVGRRRKKRTRTDKRRGQGNVKGVIMMRGWRVASAWTPKAIVRMRTMTMTRARVPVPVRGWGWGWG